MASSSKIEFFSKQNSTAQIRKAIDLFVEYMVFYYS